MPPLERGSRLDHICLARSNDDRTRRVAPQVPVAGRGAGSAEASSGGSLCPTAIIIPPPSLVATLGPLLPIRRDGLLSSQAPPSPLLPSNAPPPYPPPNLVACRANLAQLPMIILSAVVSPAEEETGRAGVLPRGNNEQRPISHKLAEEVLASRAATSQALGWCCQAHLLPPKPSAAPPCTARTFKGKAPTSLPSMAWGYSRLGLILDNH